MHNILTKLYTFGYFVCALQRNIHLHSHHIDFFYSGTNLKYVAGDY